MTSPAKLLYLSILCLIIGIFFFLLLFVYENKENEGFTPKFGGGNESEWDVLKTNISNLIFYKLKPLLGVFFAKLLKPLRSLTGVQDNTGKLVNDALKLFYAYLRTNGRFFRIETHKTESHEELHDTKDAIYDKLKNIFKEDKQLKDYVRGLYEKWESMDFRFFGDETDIPVRDIISQRGSRSNNHVGNREYLKCVEKYSWKYSKARGSDKDAIVLKIMNEISSQGRCFLKRESTELYYQGWETIMEKIKQRLRDCAKKDAPVFGITAEGYETANTESTLEDSDDDLNDPIIEDDFNAYATMLENSNHSLGIASTIQPIAETGNP